MHKVRYSVHDPKQNCVFSGFSDSVMKAKISFYCSLDGIGILHHLKGCFNLFQVRRGSPFGSQGGRFSFQDPPYFHELHFRITLNRQKYRERFKGFGIMAAPDKSAFSRSDIKNPQGSQAGPWRPTRKVFSGRFSLSLPHSLSMIFRAAVLVEQDRTPGQGEDTLNQDAWIASP